jgi:hypothetical protein
MTILVDEAIWRWRGRRWAHLVSDTDPAELHDFAHRLGLPYLAFQGDHYDIHTDLRLEAIRQGAKPVAGRELVVALRSAGLRRRGGPEPWRWDWRRSDVDLTALDLPETADELVAVLLDGVRPPPTATEVEVARARRDGETVLVVSSPERWSVAPGLVTVDERTTVHRSAGERGTFLEWRSSA